jgi:hypothetical protein
VKGGVCVGHGAKRPCMIEDCVRNLFKDKRCHYHYRCSLGDSGFSDWDPSITTVMGIDMLGFECLAYLGMAKNNTGQICAIEAWEDVFAFLGGCRSWREASIDYLNFIKPKIGLMPTLGYFDRKLNVDGFLSNLAEDDRFRSATTIYVPCV